MLKNNITVIDTETTNLYANQAEIVEIAAAHWDGSDWQVESTLLGAVNGIPPEASAKNNISNKMIAGLPTFKQSSNKVATLMRWPNSQYYVAHNAKYDRTVLSRAWRDAGRPGDAEICEDNNRWICTWRLSQHLFHHDFPDIEYGLNYLRYKLDLPVDDNIQLHRAKDDTYLCAKLLDYLVQYAFDNNWIQSKYAHDPFLTLNLLCWEPVPIDKWPFGKYKGTKLTDIPTDYYMWALSNLPALKEDGSEYDWDLAENLKNVLTQRINNQD